MSETRAWHEARGYDWMRMYGGYFFTVSHEELSAEDLGLGAFVMFLANKYGRQPDGSGLCVTEDGQPYSLERLARRMKMTVKRVEASLSKWFTTGTITRNSAGVLCVPKLRYHQESKKPDAKKKRKYRARKRKSAVGTPRGQRGGHVHPRVHSDVRQNKKQKQKENQNQKAADAALSAAATAAAIAVAPVVVGVWNECRDVPERGPSLPDAKVLGPIEPLVELIERDPRYGEREFWERDIAAALREADALPWLDAIGKMTLSRLLRRPRSPPGAVAPIVKLVDGEYRERGKVAQERFRAWKREREHAQPSNAKPRASPDATPPTLEPPANASPIVLEVFRVAKRLTASRL